MSIFENVYGVGLSKTGTTSLNDALNILEYRSIHFPTNLQSLYTSYYNAATDTPICLWYKHLLHYFPHAKIILTTRDTKKWAKSIEKHITEGSGRYNHKDPFMRSIRNALYGSVTFDYDLYVAAKERYESETIRYLENAGVEYIVLDLIKEKNPWIPICNFLHKPIPNISFPHSNKSFYTHQKLLKTA